MPRHPPGSRSCRHLGRDTIEADGIVRVFGSGHAGILADEAFYRAGGLAAGLADPRPRASSRQSGPITETTEREREDGYVQASLATQRLDPGDLVIVHSVSGETLPRRGRPLGSTTAAVRTVGITSLGAATARSAPNAPWVCGSTRSSTSRSTTGRPIGDATVRSPGLDAAVGPVSTILGAVVLHSIMVEGCRVLIERGIGPPVFTSSNVDGGDAHNRALLARYAGRVDLPLTPIEDANPMDRDDPAYRGQADYYAVAAQGVRPIRPRLRRAGSSGDARPADSSRATGSTSATVISMSVRGPATPRASGLPDGSRVTILDPNRNVLDHAATASEAPGRSRPSRRDVLKPLPVDGPFDSAALHLVIHCLPGPMSRKAAAVNDVAAVLAPTRRALRRLRSLGTAGPQTWLSRRVLAAFNRAWRLRQPRRHRGRAARDPVGRV